MFRTDPAIHRGLTCGPFTGGEDVRIRVKELIKWICPVLLAAILCPAGYMLVEGRNDASILFLWLGSGVLLIISAVSNIAAVKARTLGAYLLFSAGAFLFSMFLAVRYRERFLPGGEGIAYLIVTAVAGLLISQGAVGIRMRESRRRKAVRENDITWRETETMLEKPRIAFVMLFVAVYFTAAWYAGSREVCNLAIGSACVYLLLSVIYQFLDRTDVFLAETSGISKVPEKKIRLLRRSTMGIFAAALLIVSIPALVSGRFRLYHDVRGWYSYRDLSFDQNWEYEPPEDFMPDITDSVWAEFGRHETVRIPPWVETAGWILAGAIAAWFFSMIIRLIAGQARTFREGYEENGDVSRRLDDDDASKKLPGAAPPPLFGGTEKDRIRRHYRRMIRRYRSDVPDKSEVPEEIEGKASFPPQTDVEELHNTYEEARYGR